MSRDVATNVVNSCNLGTYLIRRSKSQEGKLVLTVRTLSGVQHILLNIDQDGSCVIEDSECSEFKFKDLSNCIQFLKCYPLFLIGNPTSVNLTDCVYIVEPPVYV